MGIILKIFLITVEAKVIILIGHVQSYRTITTSANLLQNAAKMMHDENHTSLVLYKSKKEGKDLESIQSSTAPDPGYQIYLLFLSICFG